MVTLLSSANATAHGGPMLLLPNFIPINLKRRMFRLFEDSRTKINKKG